MLLSVCSLSCDIFANENKDSLNAPEKLIPRKEQFKNWYEKANLPIRDRYGRFIELNLQNNKIGQADEGISLSTKQQTALREDTNLNLQAFCAENFENYHEALRKISRGELKISPAGYTKMRHWLVKDNAIGRPELLTDYELTEAYWMLTSRIGSSSAYFESLVTSETFYQLSEIKDYSKINIKPDPFPDDHQIGGFVMQLTSFLWNGADIDSEFKIKNKLLVADIRYLIKTNVKNLAYPICVRVYWSEHLEKWIPWLCFEYNTTERHYRVVF